MTTSMNDAVKMIKLGENFLVPLDRLPADLRRRWDVAQSMADNGQDVKGIIATLLREISGVVGVEALLRAAQNAPVSAMLIGMETIGAHGGTFTDLSTMVDEHDEEERKKEGVKDKRRLAERVRVVE